MTQNSEAAPAVPSVALVTGGGGGIGAAVARTLAARGHELGVVDLDGAAAAAVAAEVRAIGPRAVGTALDVRDSAAVDRVVAQVEQQLGPIGVLVNVAGVLQHGPTVDITDEQWRATFAVNTDGVFHVSRAVARRMTGRQAGRIVTVASNAAGVPRHGMAAYAASKAAAVQFTACLGLELAPHGIRCNVVSPGSTETDMLRALWTDGSGPEESLEGIPAEHRIGIPLKRLAQPEDVAAVVAFLASGDATHVTMQNVYVDGGAALQT
jgi:2,3-dihydro-2,3-dihydroxybenzoate dehydrogenase